MCSRHFDWVIGFLLCSHMRNLQTSRMPFGPNLQKLLKAGQSLMQSDATAQCLALVVQKLKVYFPQTRNRRILMRLLRTINDPALIKGRYQLSSGARMRGLVEGRPIAALCQHCRKLA